ncbi:MAG: hypothetical protein U0836_11470 [Pirellulales bacterium]
MCVGRLRSVVVVGAALLGVSAVALAGLQDAGTAGGTVNLSSLLQNPDAVEDDVNRVLKEKRSLGQQLVEILESKSDYGYKQRAGAAVLLGELNYRPAAKTLVAMLPEEAEHDKEVSFGYGLLDYPASDALKKMGRIGLPGVVELLKSTDDAAAQKKCLEIMIAVLGTKRGLLDALERLAAADKDPQSSQRLREARAWADKRFSETEEPPY